MGDVRSKFIAPLVQVFTLPKIEDFDLFVSAYEAVLSTFSDDALTKAANLIIGSRTTRSFPLPAECSISCKDAITAMALEERRVSRPDNRAEIRNLPSDQRYPEWTDRRRKNADELVQCNMGRQAAEEDWIWSLWDFCRENERLPDVHEAVKVRQIGMGRSLEMKTVENMSDVLGLKKMRKNITDRLKRLVQVEV